MPSLSSHFIDTDLCFGSPAVYPIASQLSAKYTAPLLPPATKVIKYNSSSPYFFFHSMGACFLSCFKTCVPTLGILLAMQNRQLFAILLNMSLYSNFVILSLLSKSLHGGYVEEPIPIIPQISSSTRTNQSILLPTLLKVGTYE